MGIKLVSASGGSVELNAPITASNYTMTVPATTDTLATQTYAQGVASNFKNRIINGAMMIDQRNSGTPITITAGTANQFPVDRMLVTCGGANITATRTTGTGAYQYDLLLTGAASVTSAIVRQRIEARNCFDLKNQTVTVQIEISASNATSASWGAYYANSMDNFAGGVTAISTGTITEITSTPTIKTFSFNAGANAVNGIQVYIDFGSLGASQTARVSGFQLEKGSTATSFDYRPYGSELALCQRYCQWLPFDMSGYQAAGGAIIQAVPYKVTMRAVPSFASLTADPDCAQAVLNNASNVFNAANSGVDGACAVLTATAAGTVRAYGYRSLTTAEL